jgi:hypothetical protein
MITPFSAARKNADGPEIKAFLAKLAGTTGRRFALMSACCILRGRKDT